MNRILLYLLILLTIFFQGESLHAQKEIYPETTIDIVITQAKQYAAHNEINLEGKYIKKVEYINNLQNPDERPYWSVYWINRKVTKGGGVELKFYSDGSTEERYYK